MLHEETQKKRNGRKDCRLIEFEVHGIVTCAPPKGYRRAAFHSPQEAAYKTEHVIEGKHAQQCIVRRERQHTTPIVSGGQQTPVCQNDSLAACGSAGCEEQYIAAFAGRIAALCPRRDPLSEIGGQFFYQVRIAAPENVNVSLPDLLLQKSVSGIFIKKNGLQSRDSGSEDRLDTVEGAVAQNAETGHPERAHLFCARKHRLREIGSALSDRRTVFFINKDCPVRVILCERSEDLCETIKFWGKCFSFHSSSIAFFNKGCVKLHQMLMNF